MRFSGAQDWIFNCVGGDRLSSNCSSLKENVNSYTDGVKNESNNDEGY